MEEILHQMVGSLSLSRYLHGFNTSQDFFHQEYAFEQREHLAPFARYLRFWKREQLVIAQTEDLDEHLDNAIVCQG